MRSRSVTRSPRPRISSGVTGSVEFDKNNQNTKMDTIHYMETKPDLSWNALKWN